MKTASTKDSVSRLLAFPALIGLLSMSLLVGYTSAGRASGKEGRPVIQVAQDNTSNGEKKEQVEGGTNNPDPIAEYQTALALLKKNYYGTPIDDKKQRDLTYSAIRGMLDSLKDVYTTFLDPDEWQEMQNTTDGDFEGIGAVLLQEKTTIHINELIENSPAEKAGLKPDDVIVRVNDKSVLGKTVNDVVKVIKGKGGTKVKIGVVRGKKQLDFLITRARVESPTVKWWMEDGDAKIGRILLRDFNKRSIEQMIRAFDKLKQQGMKGLIFDLRNNPGGLLDTAVQVASVFVAADENPALRNTVVTIREGSGEEIRKTLKPEYYMLDKMPLVVLVNDYSASASEIASGAIKDYGIGTIIGERTYGKGKVQTLFDLRDGSALKITTALYFPPKGVDINFKVDDEGGRVPNTGGVVPDIEVKNPEDWKGINDKDKTKDKQLQKGVAFLRAKLRGMTTAQASDLVRKP